MGTAGPAGRSRLGRPGLAALALVLLVPLLAVGAVSWPSAPVARRDAAPAAEDAGRIVYAGTEHRSLGRVTAPGSSEPLFGSGPAHLDRQPSARGELTVFTSLRDGPRPQVYLRQGDGSVRKLTTGRDAAHPRLAPDRASVVFDSVESGGRRDLWIVGVDGSGARKLTDSAADERSPTFSPDGTRIAYSSDTDTARGRQIYARALAGGPQTRISHGPAGDATEPVWNPVADPAHRDLVAYTLKPREASGTRLRVTDGGGLDVPLLGGAAANWNARSADWLPEGDETVFVSPERICDCNTTYDHVYRARARAAEEPRLVLEEDRAVASPTWLGSQADGAAVVERTSAPATRTATVQDIRADGADPRDLGLTVLKEDPAADTTTDPAADPLFNPREGYDPWTERQNYTPDGRRIVVTRFEDSEAGRIQRIWLADADGTNAAPMPLAGRGPRDWDTDPAFSPDGKFLAFTRTSPGGTGGKGGPGRILIADATSGALVGRIEPPAGQRPGGDAQPAWSPDGTVIAFTRNHVIDGGGGNKHVWTAPVASPDRQRDLSAALCPGNCQVIDDSPAFSPDGRTVALNRKDGGGRINERNGVLLASPAGDGCRVVLPVGLRDDPGACRRELPDNTTTGPFQPRDVAWSADGGTLVFSARRALAPNSPEGLKTLDLADGKLTHLTRALPGRQKEPGVRQSVDLALDAPSTSPPVKVGSATSVTVTVTNKGPAASPGTVFTAALPPGVRLDRLSSTTGRCADGSPQCALGVLAPGASAQVTARLTGVTTGRQRLDWSVAGAVIDPRPSDNAASTGIEVEDRERPPTRPPTTAPPTPTTPPTRPPTTTPAPPTVRPPAPPAPPPPPAAGPGVTVMAQPTPGFVGGRVVVTYLVRNGENALATGLRLKLGLPARVPAEPLPAGCAAGECALPDLAPGDTTVTRVVLKPDKALTARIVATLTTTGTDADPGDNVAQVPLRILRPRIVAVPPVGKPGSVTLVRGRDFPPGAPVTLTWDPGITAAAAPSRPGADFRFTAQLLILTKDRTEPRTITARGPGFSPVTTPFLVVNGSVQPPYEVDRR
ncbi:DUF11 domain-containing protein [Streptomyces albireticuli]|uniref:DUF11 domain-containing protein n=1 Tax=Streptomyces albireticuli TaxID=1940 RepID=UPI001E4B6A84|nr:DUF11 domain-containing protein [Streptomyces albireticuli]MCD9196243.1 DUF11 domain-containing protein [Streptomyces albireticuli]